MSLILHIDCYSRYNGIKLPIISQKCISRYLKQPAIISGLSQVFNTTRTSKLKSCRTELNYEKPVFRYFILICPILEKDGRGTQYRSFPFVTSYKQSLSRPKFKFTEFQTYTLYNVRLIYHSEEYIEFPHSTVMPLAYSILCQLGFHAYYCSHDHDQSSCSPLPLFWYITLFPNFNQCILRGVVDLSNGASDFIFLHAIFI